MSYKSSLALLTAWQLASAMPAQTSPYDKLSKRQGGDGNINGCTESGCTDCPFFFTTGAGFPECRIFDTEQLKDAGYPVEDNGQTTIFFDVPPLDPGCQVIVRTPVVPTDNDCGGNVLIAQGATCAPVRVDSTFITLFCCGTGDCSAAGAPPARTSANPAINAFNGGARYLNMHDRDGNVIEPRPLQESDYAAIEKRAAKAAAAPAPAQSKAEVVPEPFKLKKRDCETFGVTREPYSVSGGNNIVSDTVSCGQTEPCSATLGNSVTESFGIDVSVSVGDPLGIVSASVGVSYEMSIERSFMGQFMFGPGERGYVVFVPILTCVEGVFEGDCEGNGEQVVACGPTRSAGEMTGDLRAVLIRG